MIQVRENATMDNDRLIIEYACERFTRSCRKWFNLQSKVLLMKKVWGNMDMGGLCWKMLDYRLHRVTTRFSWRNPANDVPETWSDVLALLSIKWARGNRLGISCVVAGECESAVWRIALIKFGMRKVSNLRMRLMTSKAGLKTESWKNKKMKIRKPKELRHERKRS